MKSTPKNVFSCAATAAFKPHRLTLYVAQVCRVHAALLIRFAGDQQ
jgi:hypothetical protein